MGAGCAARRILDVDLQASDLAAFALLLFSFSVHEAAHAWAADRLGDSTARERGRLTLNPLPHLDLWWSVLIPFLMLTTAGFFFGGGKPVPVSLHRLRQPRRDWMLVSAAGPASNILLAVLFALVFGASKRFGVWPPGATGYDILMTAVAFNLFLAAFNMVPIPPLDGSRVLAGLLPDRAASALMRVERFGFLILIALLWLPGTIPGFPNVIGGLWRAFVVPVGNTLLGLVG